MNPRDLPQIPETPPAADDPRVYFSAERTLLSWLRLGIGIMAFGFVVARFGLFLKLVRTGGDGSSSIFSVGVGAMLVLLGAGSILLGALRYRSFCKTLKAGEIPDSSSTTAPILLCALISLVGFLLFAHLLM